MRHLNPALERLEERVAPCTGLPVCIGLCGGGGDGGAGGGGQSSAGGSGSSARSNDGTSASGSKSSKSKSHGSCSS